VSALVDDDPEADDPPLFLDSRARRRHRRARAGAPTDSQILATLLTDDPAPGAVRGGTVRLHAPTGTLLLPPTRGGLPRRHLLRVAGVALLGVLLCSILLLALCAKG
jgi:hypothetical protein